MKKDQIPEDHRLLFYKPWWIPLAEAVGFAVMIVSLLAVLFLLGA
jgi:hypothetical protein